METAEEREGRKRKGARKDGEEKITASAASEARGKSTNPAPSFSLSSRLRLFRIDGYRYALPLDDAAMLRCSEMRVPRREASRKRLVAPTTDYAFPGNSRTNGSLPPPLSFVKELVFN